jgi:hypothetical protein
MRRRTASLLLLAALLAVVVFGRPGARTALGQDPTIPTRTPTPGASSPTATSPSAPPTATDDDTNPPPPATATATATLPFAASLTPTATGTPPAGASLTPTATATLAGALPPPLPGNGVVGVGCDDTPFIRAIDLTLVFAGPGADYAAVAELIKDETRIIIGRAEFAPWWQVQVTETLIGWVADEDVDEFGNTGRVPVAPPPEINGVTPTPGLPWNPTPLPFACTVTPTPTPTPTATPTTTPTPTAAAGATETAAAATVDAVLQAGGDTASGGAAAGLPGSSGEGDSKVLPVSESGPPPSSYILPLAGVGLVAAGIIVALLARSGSSSAAATTKKPGE